MNNDKLKVFVIDDAKTMRGLTKRMLNKIGITNIIESEKRSRCVTTGSRGQSNF